ncbi:MAG: hypothetical protein Kow00120_14570 [Anaerolineae bacterium]
MQFQCQRGVRGQERAQEVMRSPGAQVWRDVVGAGGQRLLTASGIGVIAPLSSRHVSSSNSGADAETT